MNNIIGIYDFMADTIADLIKINFSIENYFIKDILWYQDTKAEIHKVIPLLLYDDNEMSLIQITRQLGLPQFIQDLNQLRKKWTLEKEYEKIMFLLYCIDYIIKDRVLFFQDNQNEIIALNSNYNENGIFLLPYYDCSWKRKSRGKQHGYTLNHSLSNTYFIQKEKLGKLTIKHIVIANDLFPITNIRHTLKIGCSSVTNLETISAPKTIVIDSTKYFAVDEFKNKSIVKEKVLSVLEEAKKQEIDILVFPEMLGTEELISEVKEKIDTNYDYQEYPKIIVLPSLWKENTNVSDIIYGDAFSNDNIFHQAKQNPVILSQGKEYIIPDNILYVVHVEKIGRICIAICKDFLTNNYLDILLEDIQSSLIIVPSFSTGSFDFFNQIDKCKSYDTDVIWINSCSALNLDKSKEKNFEHVGAVLKSGKGSGKIDYFSRMDCQKKCLCDICLFTSEIETLII